MKKFEARISNYGIHAVEEDQRISEASKKLAFIRREALLREVERVESAVKFVSEYVQLLLS